MPKTRKLVCITCWIPVEPIRKAVKMVGHGATDEIRYKHKSLRDETGVAYCGKTVLLREDLKWATEVTE